MCPGSQFSRADREDLQRRGIAVVEAERQLELLENPPAPASLTRACHPGEGITVLPENEHGELERRWGEFAHRSRPVKFVPASGAATRMFASVLSINEARGDPSADALAAAAAGGDDGARQIMDVADGIERLPFFGALDLAAQASETGLTKLRAHPARLLSLITGPAGLGLASLPKGLIPFHRYGSDSRTAFEEHLHEAAGYAVGGDGSAAVHFTVSPEHQRSFQEATVEAERSAATATGARFEIGFSTQNTRTDTLSLGSEGSPLRSADGRLIFRPAGHGALIHNLGRLDAEVVFIKNIDNIAPAHRHASTASWKRHLGGHLLNLRRQAFELLDRLERGDAAAIVEALDFCAHQLALRFPAQFTDQPQDALRAFLIERLDRPLRVAGVVRNSGEPGGGPFWVSETWPGQTGPGASWPGQTGPGESWPGESGQIVETSQIDRTSDRQVSILRSASHFNPVDVVCSLHDRHGQPYDLTRFTDPAASFVSEKQHNGRTIRALERPGLWNGAMAGWNTAFVAVPLTTFTPVKTILDLLRPDHQPASQTRRPSS